MNIENYYNDILNEHLSIFNKLSDFEDKVYALSDVIYNTFKKNGKLIICGNGGSAADSQHIAAEFVGRFEIERGPLPAIALTTDTSILTCVGNDYNFDQIFSRQIQAIGNSNDCLIAISTSGNSQNIINAIESSNKIGMTTIGILGNDGGETLNLCNYNITVQSTKTARIQEVHIFILHAICGIIDRKITFNKK
ncbi:SIS domain-containing protein [Pseudomonadota bacterium]|nr:SIS domain-containing protein [Pseudomonadota bacterium]